MADHEMSGDLLLEALGVTAELTGTTLTAAAMRVMAQDLAGFPLPAVLDALTACRLELKRPMRLSDVLERIDDGRPGPQEAWAMIPQDEHGSVVWTDEMAQAFGVASPLISAGQTIAARQAFIESYESLVTAARRRKLPPQWTPSLGMDPSRREGALEAAVAKGRIGAERALKLVPPRDGIGNVQVLGAVADVLKKLTVRKP